LNLNWVAPSFTIAPFAGEGGPFDYTQGKLRPGEGEVKIIIYTTLALPSPIKGEGKKSPHLVIDLVCDYPENRRWGEIASLSLAMTSAYLSF
jgi:hypothetical protein